MELEPYILEAGIDPDNFFESRELVIQGLMMFHVIDKRRLELTDIAKGESLVIFDGFDIYIL